MVVRERVLLIDFAPSPGGSIMSLHGLVGELRESPFEPLVLLASSNRYAERFRALGVPLFTLDVRQGEGQVYGGAVEQVRGSQFADWARQRQPAKAIWHGGGFWMRLARRTLPSARRVRDLARHERVRLVHCNDAPSISQIGLLGARLAHLPCVCHVRHFDRMGRFERWLARSVDHFVFISQATEQHLLPHLEPSARHSVVYNGVRLGDFSPDIDGNAVRKELGLPLDVPVVGILGRLVEWKGHDVYLRALARVAQCMPGVQGLVVGDTEVTSPNLARELADLAGSLGLGQAVHFVGYRTDTARMLAAMDILAHSSTSPEPFGRVLIEGMAMARPVVASNAGGVSEIVVHGETGFLAPPGDADGFAQAMLELLSDRQKAASYGRAGRRRVEELFTIEHHARMMQDVYGAVLGDR
jgi:glycosyltransferase involved in cell wall biosynthesis